MLYSKYKWNIDKNVVQNNDQIIDYLLKKKQLSKNDFANCNINNLHDPYLLKDMKKTVDKIKSTILNNKKIIIFGDYDCDGVTSTSVLYKTLTDLGARVDFLLPNRFIDGYGLNINVCEKIVKNGFDLVITVDNGITAFEEVKYLNSNNIDVIITDHHEVKDDLPKAYSIIHTGISDDYPYKSLAGVGVVFKLVMALNPDNYLKYIDEVMIGTIADMMPLTQENRVIVNLGLNAIKNNDQYGISILLRSLNLKNVKENDIGFKIAPLINSCGRLKDASLAVNLLISIDKEEAQKIVNEITELNIERKKITNDLTNECLNLVDDSKNIIVLYGADYHEGVIGIVAQRLMEKYQKPVIIFTGKDKVKGSARSFGNVSMIHLLKQSEMYLNYYGGHSAACGLSISLDKLDEFTNYINGLLEGVINDVYLDIDYNLSDSVISVDLIKKLNRYNLDRTYFYFKDVEILSKSIVGNSHTKMKIKLGKNTIEAIMFNDLYYYYNLVNGCKVDIVFTLAINKWNNNESSQIFIKDISSKELLFIDSRSTNMLKESHKYIDKNIYCLIDRIPKNFTELNNIIKDNIDKNFCIAVNEKSSLSYCEINQFHFQEIYKLIKSEPKVNIDLLCKNTKLSESNVKFVINVFLELEFVIIEDGFVSTIENVKKKLLTHSDLYNTYVDQCVVNKFLIYSSKREIVDYINTIMKE